MSEQLLSPGEIEALQPSGQDKADKAPAPPVEPRDFRRPLVCSSETLESLRQTMRSAAQGLAEEFGKMLQLKVQTELTSLDQERFESVVSSVQEPCCAFRLKMEPMPSPGLIVLDVAVALAAVDRLLGGSGKTKLEARELRDAEKPIVERFALQAFQGLAKALPASAKCNPALAGYLAKRSEIRFIEPGDAVLAVGFGLGGDLPAGQIRFAIPFSNLSAIVGRGGAKGKDAQSRSGAVPPAVVAAIYPFPVSASADLGHGRILIGDLLLLEPGDVLPLATKVGDLAKVSIAGMPAFQGRLGTKDGRWAVEIDSAIPGGRIGGKR